MGKNKKPSKLTKKNQEIADDLYENITDNDSNASSESQEKITTPKNRKEIENKLKTKMNKPNGVDTVINLLNDLIDKNTASSKKKTLNDLNDSDNNSDTPSLKDEQHKILEKSEKIKSLREEKIKKFKNIVERDQTKQLVETFGTQVVKPLYILATEIFLKNPVGIPMLKDTIPQISNKILSVINDANEKRELRNLNNKRNMMNPQMNNMNQPFMNQPYMNNMSPQHMNNMSPQHMNNMPMQHMNNMTPQHMNNMPQQHMNNMNQQQNRFMDNDDMLMDVTPNNKELYRNSFFKNN